jgi:hypothetical protein
VDVGVLLYDVFCGVMGDEELVRVDESIGYGVVRGGEKECVDELE